MKVRISKTRSDYRWCVYLPGRGNVFASGKGYNLERCRTIAWTVLQLHMQGDGPPLHWASTRWEWEEVGIAPEIVSASKPPHSENAP